MRDNDKKSSIVLAVIGIIPVVWLGLKIAPNVKGGLPAILNGVMSSLNNPFAIELCGDSVKTVLVLLIAYGMAIGVYLSTRKNYRRREEHGSAKWEADDAECMRRHQCEEAPPQSEYIGLRRFRRR